MDAIALVADQIDDGRRLLDRLGDNGIDVRAACWVKPADEDRWQLYIATPAVDELGAIAAYRQVFTALRSLNGVSVTDSDIKLVGASHPVPQDVHFILERFPGKTFLAPPQFQLLGAMPIEEAYIYPPARKKPAEVTVYGLVYRGDPSKTLHLSLDPQDPNSWLEVEAGGEHRKYPAQIGTDWLVAVPDDAKLERDSYGLRVLAWNLRGNRVQSRANEVWSLAKLGLHGFRFLREPAVSPSV
jgi:hypothetical protein